MQNSISSTLPKVDISQKTPANNTPTNEGSQVDASFNQLLGVAQGAKKNITANDQLSADIDIFSDSLLDMSFTGGIMPECAQGLPLSEREINNHSIQGGGDEGVVLVTWQQLQIDRPRQSGGFASDLQLGSAATSASFLKAANQPIELMTESSAGIDLSTTPQTRTIDNSAARAPVALTVTQNALNDPAWAQAMSAKISWMAGNGVHTATMQLHPAELGSIHIQLSVNGDTTSVQIQAQQKDTSDLMEKMMPRLHSGMENQGLRLEEAKVTHNPNLNDGAATNAGQQFAGQSAGDRSGAANNGRDANQTGLDNNLDGDDASLHGALNASVTLQNSGVDYYA